MWVVCGGVLVRRWYVGCIGDEVVCVGVLVRRWYVGVYW